MLTSKEFLVQPLNYLAGACAVAADSADLLAGLAAGRRDDRARRL